MTIVCCNVSDCLCTIAIRLLQHHPALLHYFIPCCTSLQYFVLYYSTIWQYFALFSTKLHFFVICFTLLHFVKLFSIINPSFCAQIVLHLKKKLIVLSQQGFVSLSVVFIQICFVVFLQYCAICVIDCYRWEEGHSAVGSQRGFSAPALNQKQINTTLSPTENHLQSQYSYFSQFFNCISLTSSILFIFSIYQYLNISQSPFSK